MCFLFAGTVPGVDRLTDNPLPPPNAADSSIAHTHYIWKKGNEKAGTGERSQTLLVGIQKRSKVGQGWRLEYLKIIAKQATILIWYT